MSYADSTPFRRLDGGRIETLGVSYSGKIYSIGASWPLEVWHVKPGMLWSGMGRPWRRTAAKLFLVTVTGDEAKIIKECEPGRFWKARRKEFLAEMARRVGLDDYGY